jgi:hypothetical protein
VAGAVLTAGDSEASCHGLGEPPMGKALKATPAPLASRKQAVIYARVS